MKPRSKTAMKREADRLFSKLVRERGICEAEGWAVPAAGCSGNLQTAHIIPRRYLSVRWDEENAFSMCAAHHVYFTHFPLEFAQFVGLRLGPTKYEDLRDRALAAKGSPDYDAVLARLKESAPV